MNRSISSLSWLGNSPDLNPTVWSNTNRHNVHRYYQEYIWNKLLRQWHCLGENFPKDLVEHCENSKGSTQGWRWTTNTDPSVTYKIFITVEEWNYIIVLSVTRGKCSHQNVSSILTFCNVLLSWTCRANVKANSPIKPCPSARTGCTYKYSFVVDVSEQNLVTITICAVFF